MLSTEPSAILIADLGYGDAGKGSIVDALSRGLPVHTIVRYNGGAQAAHNVVTPDGRHHTFAQFGSGTFLPGVRTHLSRFMILHPLAMLAEERHLRSLGVADAFARTTIDCNALVISPFQQAANRIKEIARGDARHGSCGMGIGETMADALAFGADVLFARDLACRDRLVKKLAFLRDAKIAQLESTLADLPNTPQIEEERRILYGPDVIEITADMYQHFARLVQITAPETLGSLLRTPGVTLFEGAQGVLLDEWYGFYPYNSWSTLTFKNAGILLAENNFSGSTLKLGLTRGYATRHGAGPFVTEDAALTAQVQDFHNENNPWQRRFRVGYLDLVALRYALQVTGPVDGLVITNLDRMQAIPDWQVCSAYQHPGSAPNLADYFVSPVENQPGSPSGSPVSSLSAIRVPPDPTDLARQETLTRLLMEMRPVYSSYSRDDYIERVGQALGLPVVLTSSGPTALEKSFIADYADGADYADKKDLSFYNHNFAQNCEQPILRSLTTYLPEAE